MLCTRHVNIAVVMVEKFFRWATAVGPTGVVFRNFSVLFHRSRNMERKDPRCRASFRLLQDRKRWWSHIALQNVSLCKLHISIKMIFSCIFCTFCKNPCLVHTGFFSMAEGNGWSYAHTHHVSFFRWNPSRHNGFRQCALEVFNFTVAQPQLGITTVSDAVDWSNKAGSRLGRVSTLTVRSL